MTRVPNAWRCTLHVPLRSTATLTRADDQAIACIREASGRHFDPTVVEALLAMIGETGDDVGGSAPKRAAAAEK